MKGNRVRCVGVALLLVAVSSAGGAGRPAVVPAEWRQVAADSARSRYVPDTIRPPLSIAWRVPAPLGFTSLLATGDLLVLGTRHDDGRAAMAGIRTRDGRVLWRQGAFHDPGWVPLPTLAADRSIFTSFPDEILGFKASDGSREFRHPLGKHLEGSAMARLRSGPLLVALSPGLDDYSRPALLLAMDAGTGRIRWQRELKAGYWTQGTSGGAPFYAFKPFSIGEFPGLPGWLFLQSGDTLVTLEAGTYRVRGLRYATINRHSPAAAGGERLYLLSTEANLSRARHPAELWTLDRRARCIARRKLPGSGSSIRAFAPPVVTPRYVLAWNGRHMWAVSRTTGRIAWKSRGGAYEGLEDSPAPAVAGQVVYAVTSSSENTSDDLLIAFSQATGRKLWSLRLGYRIYSMAAHRGSLYLLGTVPKTPTVAWFLFKLSPRSGRQR
jgi:outer membrane protein assembly factor BamB